MKVDVFDFIGDGVIIFFGLLVIGWSFVWWVWLVLI